jgi:hypothetical protein
MNWGIEDLIAATGLLAATWLGITLVLRTVKGAGARVILVVGVLLVVVAVWAHLAIQLM